MVILVIIGIIVVIGLFNTYRDEFISIIKNVILVGLLSGAGLLIAAFPWISPLIAVGFFAIYFYVRHVKLKKYIGILDEYGICDLAKEGASDSIRDRMIENNTAAKVNNQLCISVKYYFDIIKQIDQLGLVSATALRQICRNYAPKISDKYADLTGQCAVVWKKFAEMTDSDGEKYYLSSALLFACRKIFDTEGAVTADEFTELCGQLRIPPHMKNELPTIAQTALNYLVSDGKAETIPLSQMNGQILYRSNTPAENTHLVRQVINLDAD